MPAIQEMMANVRRAEQLGFDSIWSGDHLIMHSPIMDVMTVLASFAAITTRYPRYGGVSHAVAPSCGYRQAGDFLDLLSGGRFIFGVGVGGEIVREFDAVGVPVQERAAAPMKGWKSSPASFVRTMSPTKGNTTRFTMSPWRLAHSNSPIHRSGWVALRGGLASHSALWQLLARLSGE